MKKLLTILLLAINTTTYSAEEMIMNNENETTPYTHYTVLAEGTCGEMIDGFTCSKGKAIMGIKVWASNIDEPSAMAKSIGSQIGFKVLGEIQIYETEAKEPPKENPYGYDIQFTSFD